MHAECEACSLLSGVATCSSASPASCSPGSLQLPSGICLPPKLPPRILSAEDTSRHARAYSC
eukprot:3109941-Alexandrium_andersonii.AAC.1